MTDKFDLCAFMPADTPKYMTGSWLGALHFALGDPAIVAAYRADSGDKWTPGRSPLDQMIDAATGRDRDFICDFTRWFNVNVWGPIEDHADDGVIGVGS